MARTLDLLAVELALVERTVVVGTQVVEGVELAVDVAHGYFVVANGEKRNPLRWDIGGLAHGVPVRHAIADQMASCSAACSSLPITDWKKPSTMSRSAVERSRPRLCR